MKDILKVLNRPADAFQDGHKGIAWLLAGSVIVINILVDLLFGKLSRDSYDFDLSKQLIAVGMGIVTYLLICTIFWLVCRCFGSRTPLRIYINTWGLTFFPTILCAIAVVYSEHYFNLFWNNKLLGMLLSIVFVGVLIWKTVLYIIYLKEVAELKRGSFLGAFLVIAIFIVLLAVMDGYFGLKTPVL